MDAGIVFGLLAMLGYGIEAALTKVPAKEIGARRMVFYRNLAVSFLLAIALLFMWDSVVVDTQFILIAIGIAIIGYIPLLTFYQGLKVGNVGIVTSVANTSVVFTVLFAIIFLNESLIPTQTVAIATIIIGVALISLNFKDLKNSPLVKLASGLPYAVITSILWGLVFFLFKYPVDVIGPFLTAFIIEVGIAITAGTHLAASRITLVMPTKRTIKLLAIHAVAGSVALVAFNKGVQTDSVSIVAALTMSSPLVATLLDRIIYKTTLTKMKLLAIVLIVSGIITLAIV